MKKIMSIIAVILCLSMLFAACNNIDDNTQTTVSDSESTMEDVSLNETDAEVIKLGLLKGPTGIGAAYLLKNNKEGTANAEYDVNIAPSPEIIKTALLSGELDMAALPTNLAAVLNAKTQGKIQILAVNTLGVLHIMTNDDSIKAVSDLRGKTILSSGQGAAPEYVLNFILQKNGLTPGKDVTVEYASEHAEVIAKAVAEGSKYSAIVLPEPFVTQMKAKDAGFKAVIDLTAEWDKLDAGALSMGCIAVRKDYAETHNEQLKAFMKDYEASVKAVNADPEAAGKLVEEFGILKAAVAAKAIPNCNITFIAGEEMKEKVSAFLDVLFSFNPASVGGKAPAEDFYCIVE